jgi:hypothetical protein
MNLPHPFQMVCNACGGSNMSPWLRGKWDFSKQCWVLDDDPDFAYCEDCKRPRRVKR